MIVDLPVKISVLALVISSCTLIISFYYQSRSARAVEMDTLFKHWQYYEKYVSELAISGKSSDPLLLQIAFLNAANFIENSCLIYNSKLSSSLIKKNLLAIISDHIASTDHVLRLKNSSYDDQLKLFNISNEGYTETRAFISSHKPLLRQKGYRVDGSILSPD